MLKTIHCKNFGEMSLKAADFIAGEIANAKRQYSISFPGGKSVEGILRELVKMQIPWQAVNAFMSDERLVPPNDPLSNYRQADEILFSKAPGIHAFPFDMEKGLHEYNRQFTAVTKGRLDMIVLGVGGDGHIASLFPNNPALKSGESGYIAVENAPKGPPKRVSLSSEAIANAENAVLLFASGEKRGAYGKFTDHDVPVSECPAKIALKAKRTIAFTVFGG